MTTKLSQLYPKGVRALARDQISHFILGKLAAAAPLGFTVNYIKHRRGGRGFGQLEFSNLRTIVGHCVGATPKD